MDHLTKPPGHEAPPPPVLTKPREQIWTFLVVDPLAVRLARALAPHPRVTPDGVTLAAGALALAAATCFALGELRAAGVLFMLRFLLDCVDGKLARARGTSSERGAALDLAVDVAGILTCFAAAAWYAVDQDALPLPAAFALLVLVGFYNWVLQYRKQLAARSGQGDGGMRHAISSDVPVVRAWVAWCDRHDVNPVPYAVEAETLALGLLPLVGLVSWLAGGLWIALGFYLLAAAVNVRRVWRLAGTGPARLITARPTEEIP